MCLDMYRRVNSMSACSVGDAAKPCSLCELELLPVPPLAGLRIEPAIPAASPRQWLMAYDIAQL